MSTAILRLPVRAIHHKVSQLHAIKMPWRGLYILAGICAVVLLVLYIFGVNKLTQGAYVLRNGNKQVASLISQNQDLQAQFAQSSFLGGIQQQAGQLGFEKTQNVTYVQLLQGSVAMVK